MLEAMEVSNETTIRDSNECKVLFTNTSIGDVLSDACSEIDDTLKRIHSSHKGVIGVIVVDSDGV
ncbi:unnamed protein product, partial [Oppiella nova]